MSIAALSALSAYTIQPTTVASRATACAEDCGCDRCLLMSEPAQASSFLSREDTVEISPEAIARADDENQFGRDANQEGSMGEPRAANGEPLDESEKKQVETLKDRDREVRAHEAAHLAAAGGHASGGPTYTYEQGPDGKRYAVGGEVNVDTSEEKTPEATLRKMEQIQRAAHAPAEPSGKDQAVAAAAAQKANDARREIAAQRAAESQSTTFGQADSESGRGRVLDLVA